MAQSPIDIIHAYAKCHPAEDATMRRSLDYLEAASGDITARSTVPAHITASVLILQGPALLTIWHPYLEMWIQPGGHVDPGEEIPVAALREATEETGLKCALIDEAPFDIDCLFVPANPKKGEAEHWHIDFRYLMRPLDAAPVASAELRTLCVPVSTLGELSPSLARLVHKLKQCAEKC